MLMRGERPITHPPGHEQIRCVVCVRMQQREKEEEVRLQAHLEKRMNTMLALKSDIAANRVSALTKVKGHPPSDPKSASGIEAT